MIRSEFTMLPKFQAELEEIKKNGITKELLYKIIQKHQPNAIYNKSLYNMYKGLDGYVSIHNREPRYEGENPINNKIANDFFGEIVDFKVGYFAGEPISYSYNATDEAKEEIGGDEAVDIASKTLTDFIMRNTMYGVDMQTTKNSSIYGYSGRLFYIDNDGNERVMAVNGYETIILSKTNICEPEYAIRYFKTQDINGAPYWVVQFYDDKNVTTYEGDLFSLVEKETKEHMFDYCPLQGIPNNDECMGDAEKVLSLIDDYDRVLSDNSNDIESFANALLLLCANIDDETVRKAQKSGVLVIPQIGSNTTNEPAKWITKSGNDAIIEHHLQRLEDNIYRFSCTPNLGDETFGAASGISLKFKLHGLETKCATYEACVMKASQHMWKVLCSSWAKKGININPLQITMEFTRNFPLDKLSEAQTAQAFIGAGLPKRYVFSQIAGIDDVDYIMQLLEEEKNETMDLYPDLNLMEAKDNNLNEDDNNPDDDVT